MQTMLQNNLRAEGHLSNTARMRGIRTWKEIIIPTALAGLPNPAATAWIWPSRQSKMGHFIFSESLTAGLIGGLVGTIGSRGQSNGTGVKVGPAR
jgi:hypothetical protein